MNQRLRAVASLLCVAIVTGCSDATSPDAVVSTERPLLAISDGSNASGRAGFYFLPPLVPSAAPFTGTFDATLTPEVRVCKLVAVAGGHACGTAPSDRIKTFTTAGSERITIDPVGQSYAINWNTKNNLAALQQGQNKYRVETWVGAVRLGFADLWFVSNSKEQKTVSSGYVGVVVGSPLLIKFRIEASVVGSVVVTPSTKVLFVPLTQTFVAEVRDLKGNVVPNAPVTWTTSNPSAATVNAAGVAAAVAEGDATITATSGGASGTAAITAIANPSTIVGYSTVEILRTSPCAVAVVRCESLLGNVVTDAMRAASGADFGIMNSGGLRAHLTCFGSTTGCPDPTPSSPWLITRATVFSVLPFGFRVARVSVTGAELKGMLENGVAVPGSNAFPQVSGLCFTYSLSAPAGSRVLSAVRQATDGSCTGAAVDFGSGASYTIVEDTFMASGGDGYQNFASRATIGELQDRVVVSYIALKTPISPAIQGRIVEVP